MIRKIATLPLLLALAGCPSQRSATPPSSVPALDTPRAILEVNATDPAVQSALADVALSTTRTVTLRYCALRKLEEAHSPQAISVGESLALTKETGADSGFLRTNAVGVLYRARKTAEGKQALARVKESSAPAAAVSAELERSGS